MLEQCCNHSKQCRNSVVVLANAMLHSKSPLRIVPCKITLTRKIFTLQSCNKRQKNTYKKAWCTCQVVVLLILRWCYTRQFATTLFNAVQRCNIACNIISSGCNIVPTLELVSLKDTGGRYDLRSNDSKLLNIPSCKSLSTLCDWSFYMAAPRLWNDLPLFIGNISSVNPFKKALKTHLLQKAFPS